MSYIVVRKPSGVLHVVTLQQKSEWVLYELASKKLYGIKDDADAECKRLNKERLKRYHEHKKMQMEIEYDAAENA